MKKFVSALIVILPLLAPASPDDRDLVLEAHRDSIHWLEMMNLAQLKAIQSCYLIAQGETQLTSQFDAFFEFFISGAGAQVVNPSTCKKVIETTLGIRLSQKLREMRIALALAKPERKTDQHELYFRDRLSDTELIGIRIHHLASLPIESSLEPLQDEEKAEALAQFARFAKATCEKFQTESKTSDSCADVASVFGGSPLISRFRAFYRAELERFRNRESLKYLKLINSMPILLYFSKAGVSAEELRSGLKDMIEHAQARTLSEGSGSDLWFYQTQWALPYTKAVLKKKYPEKDFSQALGSLLQNGQSTSTYISVGKASASIASLLACYLVPAGRGVSLIVWMISRRSCFLGVGLIVNTTFMAEAFINLHHANTLLLSAIEGSKSALTAQDVLDARRQAWFATLLFPLFLSVPK